MSVFLLYFIIIFNKLFQYSSCMCRIYSTILIRKNLSLAWEIFSSLSFENDLNSDTMYELYMRIHSEKSWELWGLWADKYPSY